jgi:putative sterol carrier protein
MAINGGKLEKGLNASASTKLTMNADVLKKVFLEFDMSAAMQAFMSGQIKAEGDMTKLMTLQTARPSAEQKALFAQVLAI